VHRSIIRAYFFLFVLTSSFTIHAAGLGNFTLNSYLGQPFKAEIDIVSINKEDISTLSAKLASRKTFQHLNVDYAPFLSEFEINIENRINGQPYVKITSPQRVVEPFLSILVELNWSSGLLIREYAVLLDPPEDSLKPALPVVEVEIVAEVEAEAEAEAETETVPSVAQPEPVTTEKPETTYIPVKSGDNLTKIAQKAAYPNVQLNQMLVALHRANRKAFSGNNMNRLKTGPILRIPDASEVAAISPGEADKEVKMQTNNWELYRQKLAAEVSSAALVGEESAQAAAGKIATKIDDSAKASVKQSEEKLSISNGEGILEGSTGDSATNSSQDYIAALEDSAISKAKALNEANENIAILEENIEKLRKLLELKNAGISELQTPAGDTSNAAAEIKSPPTITEESVPDNNESSQEGKDLSGSAAEKLGVDLPVAGTDVPNSKVAPAPPPVKNPPLIIAEKTPMIDSLIENIEYVGAALLLLLIGLFAMSKGKKEVVNGDTTPKADSSNSENNNDSDNVVILDSLVSDDTKDNDTSMNFSDVSESEEATPAPVLPEEDLAGINLNIDDSVTTEPVGVKPVEKSGRWHEIATKIDLARAYQEMGDNDGAKEALQEVLKDGDVEQQKSAKIILDKL
jgi:FimV-like protein